ncbi:hypothetical protein [Paracoccus sp. SSK6]|uniref:hypothetical protein n=1 Tax=Paracoccus sp. SSK6 TaxID=3143131 RepID=UPI00321B39FF
MTFLRLIPLRAWFIVAAVAAAAALTWWGVGVYEAGKAAMAQVVVLQRDLAAANLALELERARAALDASAVADEADAQLARQDALDTLLEDIDRAPSSADAPVAPVLRDALRSLK